MNTVETKSIETKKLKFGMSEPLGLSLMERVFPVSPLILL